MATENENRATDATDHIEHIDKALHRRASSQESGVRRDTPIRGMDRDPANPRSIPGTAADTAEPFDEETVSAQEVDGGNRQAEDELRQAAREAEEDDELE